jgi:hypothetical protein
VGPDRWGKLVEDIILEDTLRLDDAYRRQEASKSAVMAGKRYTDVTDATAVRSAIKVTEPTPLMFALVTPINCAPSTLWRTKSLRMWTEGR